MGLLIPVCASLIMASAESSTGGSTLSTGVFSFEAGSAPFSVAIGDLNGDGKPDMAVANYSSRAVSVLLGRGDGRFAAKVDFLTGSFPRSVAIGDVSGDGKQDLAVANNDAGTVSVLLGQGDGSFGAKVDYGTGSQPYSVAMGDVSGDGKLDLGVANSGSSTVSVLLGHGDGRFGVKADFRVGSAPLSVAIVDVSGDGKPDLVTVNGGSSSASVLLGKGDGSFGASVGYATGNTPQSVAIGDVSGDGKPDLAVANSGSNTVSVLLGNGDGSFGARMGDGTGSVAESGPIAKANDPDPFRLEGRRVRLLAPELGPRKVTGIVGEVRGDTLRFTPDKQSTSTPVRLGALSGLEVSRGTKSHVWTGVGIGLLGGALVVGAIASSSVQPGDEYEGLVIFIGGVLGGVVGMAGGAIIGSTHTERWDSVRLPISIGLLPNTHGLGLSVELTNR